MRKIIQTIVATTILTVGNLHAQSFPFVTYNAGGSAQNIRPTDCNTGTPICEYPSSCKLVARDRSTNCGYTWYKLDLPSTTYQVKDVGYSVEGSNYLQPDNDNTDQVEVYNLNGTSGLNVRTNAGTSYPIVQINGANAKVWNGQRYAVITSTDVGATTWYEIYLPSHCSQSTGWLSGDYLHYYPATVEEYSVSTSSNPPNGGSTTGDDTYDSGESVTVTASANNGYTFVSWSENGNSVSSNASYTFTISDDRDLVANFTTNPSFLPDLVVQGTTPSLNNIVSGSSTIISFSVKNNGNADAGQSIVSFHLSSNTTFQPGSDIYLAETPVPGIASTGSTSVLKQPVNIPPSTSAGTWYILVSADGTEVIDESDDDNTTYIEIEVLSSYSLADEYRDIYDGGDNSACVDFQNSNGGPADIWGMYKYQCVSYVAFKINQSWGYNYPDYKFHNYMTGNNPPTTCNENTLGARLSNACYWDERLGPGNGLSFAYEVNNIPTVGAIAHWNPGDPGVSANGAGHVAFVNSVNLDGTITITEYNWNTSTDPCAFNTRTIMPNQVGRFIHTEVGDGLGGGPVGVQEILTEKNMHIYPNPSDGTFTVELLLDFEHEVEISIFNFLGQVVYQIPAQMAVGKLSTTVTLRDDHVGVYFVRVWTGENFITKKLIINK